MKLSFVTTNDKASYVSKEDRICLSGVSKEAALNKQQKRPCVPFICLTLIIIYWAYINGNLLICFKYFLNFDKGFAETVACI